VINGTLVISNRKKDDLLVEMRKYKAFPKNGKTADVEEGEEEVGTISSYDYLLGMPMWNLTMEKVGVHFLNILT
jgi:DNA topoisomerase-2